MNPAIGYTALTAVSVVTALIGFYGLRISRTTSDFYVASRTVRPWWNASAIGGEYLSAASFLGIAGLVIVSGIDALWFPIGHTAGYLMLLFFVAAPLLRSGAYTIPDFAEARLGSARARHLTSVLVVLVGWFYIVPQLHGAALTIRTTTGLPSWVGAGAVVAVVCLTVVTGGTGTYGTLSLMVALLFGTLGLPHVLVRFYTNPDGAAARRTTLIVLGLLSLFYLFPTIYGVLGRVFLPQLAARGIPDAAVLLLPGRLVGGPGGDILSALVVAGAFAAFLSTTSGLVVSLAGVISQDLLGGNVRGFRIAAVAAAVVPLGVALGTDSLALAGSVGLVFAFTASTVCPLLLLGIWWRGLTDAGAMAGMAAGAVLCGASMLVGAQLAQDSPWRTVMVQPAAWTVPAAFLTMVAVSLATPGRLNPGMARFMSKLHVPERPHAMPGPASGPDRP
ncbi:cation acetate symporter [Arthrobacter sp. STN4]|uniref:sodium/solute symporter n=1 Tax=Arthrobacter sp. STN4 TaxID=2923276 RepID=UPI00211A5A08|nr:cation acetate symporter [Arthrobacter sp. STN4]MCQ9163482.1 cation acetate symporter [Arthrobacter sp. STN4]